MPLVVITRSGLNHLQGEYWIATYLLAPVFTMAEPRLNHLQGEYWIATSVSHTIDRIGEEMSESSPGRILDCDPSAYGVSGAMKSCLNHLQGEYWIATCLLIALFLLSA